MDHDIDLKIFLPASEQKIIFHSTPIKPVCLVLTGKPMPHLDIDLAFLYIFLISFQRLNFILKK